ncbi:MAG: acyl-CoA carboxylase subunit beta [Candidatus Rokubacteria bacterium]|nr:acyl-CoA carboxylase subunit beta [Candidatus Rokubacteria bacterium]
MTQARSWRDLLKSLAAEKARAAEMGGPEAIARTHERGKLTARERLEKLLDPGSFMEVGLLAKGRMESPGMPPEELPADGIVVGQGAIAGRPVFVAADDGTLKGGARGEAGARKFLRMKQLALASGTPYVGLLEGSASRIQDTMSSTFAGIGSSLVEQHTFSGVIPQAVALLGHCFGGPAFHAASSDFVAMVRGTSFMGMSGPPVVRGGMGEQVTSEELGSAEMHFRETGQIDYLAETEPEAVAAVRDYLSFFPQSCHELPPTRPTPDSSDRATDELLGIVPENLRRAYDSLRVIRAIVDDGVVFPLRGGFGRNLITALARLGGQPVGVVANQPMELAGILDWRAAYKLRRFVELCDAFHLPLVFLQDVPGFLVGTKVEREGTVRYAVAALLAVARATVPKLTVILRKSYGLAYLAMCGKPAGADLLFAWPSASIALMGPEAAVNTIYRRELERSPDARSLRAELETHFHGASAPAAAAERFLLDDVIDPRDTRRVLIRGLAMVERKRRRQLGFKHPIWP